MFGVGFRGDNGACAKERVHLQGILLGVGVALFRVVMIVVSPIKGSELRYNLHGSRICGRIFCREEVCKCFEVFCCVRGSGVVRTKREKMVDPFPLAYVAPRGSR